MIMNLVGSTTGILRRTSKWNLDSVGPFSCACSSSWQYCVVDRCWFASAKVDCRLKTLDRKIVILRRGVNALRMKHRSVSDRCMSILQEGFPQECQAGRIVKDSIRTTPAGTEAQHIIIQQTYLDLQTVFRPHKFSYAQCTLIA
jgi:hypothetical protein